MADDEGLATASRRLRNARDYIRDGRPNATAPELRQTLDPVRVAYETLETTAARPKPARDSVPERWAMGVEDTYSLLSAFIHDDDVIQGAALDRAPAINLLGSVSGYVHRLADKRRSERI